MCEGLQPAGAPLREGADRLLKEFEHFSQLCNTAYHWVSVSKSWPHSSFDQIDAKDYEQQVTTGVKTLFRCVKNFQARDDAENVFKVAEQIKKEMEDFQPNLPLTLGSGARGCVSGTGSS